MTDVRLPTRERVSLLVQLGVSRLLSPLWIPLTPLLMRFVFGWRVEARERAAALREYRRIRRESRAPLLVCANHLTMFDSFVIGWAIGSPGGYLRDFGAVPWNTPEEVHFASTWWKRILVYLYKCVPVKRRGDRAAVAMTLDKVRFLLARGEAVLVFPEGGRSRTGRVEVESAAYGVGRLVTSLPGCRVLCVYLRGEGQESWSDLPRRGERFHVAVKLIEPKSDRRGLRGSLDVARQITAQLAEMEHDYFDGRDGR
ncbi:MAG: lysophospholipid acyltransferase family protein [Myxococcota bacterium]